MNQKELNERLKRLQEIQKWALKSEAAQRLNAALELARSEPGIAVLPEQLDSNPWLLNCANGTLELQTGELRPHRREDLITKLCPIAFDRDARCPVWERTLSAIFDGNAALVNYLQRLSGYCLTGCVHEQLLPVFWGSGGNGKSLLFETVRGVMGEDYADVGTRELLLSDTRESHPTYLADLFGKRLVTLAETREGGRLNEEQIKQLTGGEKIKARRMRENFWEFTPTHKIWLATNHKPTVRGTDHGIWRRLRLIPFTVRFWDEAKNEKGPEDLRADKTLPDRLKGEFPGILTWMLRGCLDWQRHGMSEPKEVHAATEQYRGSQDLMAAFISECCDIETGLVALATPLYKRYRRWHEESGEPGHPMSQRRFGEAMNDRGYEKKHSGATVYLGLDLKPEQQRQPEDLPFTE